MNREKNKDSDECLKEKHIIKGENVLLAPLVFCKCKKCSIFETDTKWYLVGEKGIFRKIK